MRRGWQLDPPHKKSKIDLTVRATGTQTGQPRADSKSNCNESHDCHTSDCCDGINSHWWYISIPLDTLSFMCLQNSSYPDTVPQFPLTDGRNINITAVAQRYQRPPGTSWLSQQGSHRSKLHRNWSAACLR